jgi:hypothetical protein
MSPRLELSRERTHTTRLPDIAEELAHSIGLDVDTFIESTVLALHDQEAPEGRPGARDEVVEKATSYQWPIAGSGYAG